MRNTPQQVSADFCNGQQAKEALFCKGYEEQNRLNRRFFAGNQWYTHAAGDRPLVRLNLVRRMGEYKIGYVTRQRYQTVFVPTGVSVRSDGDANGMPQQQRPLQDLPPAAEALGRYHTYMAGRLRFESKCEQILRAAYVTGNAFLYSYYDADASGGQGELACEVLSGERVVLGDNTLENTEDQPYILVATRRKVEDVRARVAAAYGEAAAGRIKGEADRDHVTVYTKFYKQKPAIGPTTVWCVETTDRVTVREAFDTRLHRYPVSAMAWQPADNGFWCESEITHLIENQIAVNRLATANVWASISCGMPLMTVNGDTVAEEITNDPGQILRVYGTNDDVAGAVHFVAPPDCSASFRANVEELVRQTLSCNGAAGLLLSEGGLNSTLAVQTANQTTHHELRSLCERYRAFLEDTARIWLDIWQTAYSERVIRIQQDETQLCFPLYGEQAQGLRFDVQVKEAARHDSEELI